MNTKSGAYLVIIHDCVDTVPLSDSQTRLAPKAFESYLYMTYDVTSDIRNRHGTKVSYQPEVI